MRAAVENGADAIYFGLQEFNARLRAGNFATSDLPRILARLHERGVRGYVTLNTLIFCSELEEAAKLVEACVRAGVDALLVQDLGLAALAHRIAPELPLHASTQMTLTAAEAIEGLRALGIRIERVIGARELSAVELGAVRRGDVEVEAFVHGALCVAYSGQCLTSEALGGRSANRGVCAQACRLPFDLVVDGEALDPAALGGARYLVSPRDLAAYEDLGRLAENGITALKIEGRLKSARYVAATVRVYREALDAMFAEEGGRENEKNPRGGSMKEAGAMANPRMSAQTRRILEQTFSRGFTSGYLRGINHQDVVEGLCPKKRGIYLGCVTSVGPRGATVRLEGPLKPGDGIVFDSGSPEEDEQGGRVYEMRLARGGRPGERMARFDPPDSPDSTNTAGNSRADMVPPEVALSFGEGRIDFGRVHPGDGVWKTSDPEMESAIDATFAGEAPRFSRPVRAVLRGRAGEAVRLRLEDENGVAAEVSDTELAQEARRHAITREKIEEHIGRLGGTGLRLGALDVELEGALMIPFSRLNDLRRQAAEALLEARRARGLGRAVNPGALAEMRGELQENLGRDVQATGNLGQDAQATGKNPGQDVCATGNPRPDKTEAAPANSAPRLAALCRTLDQVLAAAAHPDVQVIYADFEELRHLREARPLAASGGKSFAPATLRIFKPGEERLALKLLDCDPDAILVRNLAAWRVLVATRPGLPIYADYSLNVANDLAAGLLFRAGIQQITPSYDLNIEQILDLLDRSPASQIEITIHQHMPMFHMEHCVFCRFLSKGSNASNCGRPCERHTAALRDRKGFAHPVRADAGCRNTVYNAIPQSASEYLDALRRAGARRFRVELLDEDAGGTRRLLDAYADALCGRADARDLWRRLRATGGLGVTRGPLGAE